MSNIRENIPAANRLDGIWNGEFAEDILNINDPAFVLLESFSMDHKIGPCRWQTRGSSLPEKGMDCLVGYDEFQTPYVIAWWDGLPLAPFANIVPTKLIADESGVSADFSGAFSPFVAQTKSDNSQPCDFLVSPTADCWWEVGVQLLVRNKTAAWHRLECYLGLFDITASFGNPDSLGQTKQTVHGEHHQTATDWIQIRGHALWALDAGVSYRGRFIIDAATGGTWNYHRGGAYFIYTNYGAKPRL